MLDDKFTMKSAEASAATQASLHNGDIVSPSFEMITNYCDNPIRDNNETGATVIVRNHNTGNSNNHVMTNHHGHRHQVVISTFLMTVSKS